jgi:hypothetical protein
MERSPLLPLERITTHVPGDCLVKSEVDEIRATNRNSKKVQ